MIATLVLFLSLGLDTLAVSVGLGLSGLPRSRWVRVGVTFALFEGLMPVLGLLIGKSLSEKLGEIAAYAAAVILIVIGLLALREALTEDDNNDGDDLVEKTQGNRLLLTGLSVSLDELAVGFSLGVLQVPVGIALIYIAIQAFALTFIGVSFGGRLGAHLGRRAELASGIILTLLGVALLVGEVTAVTFL